MPNQLSKCAIVMLLVLQAMPGVFAAPVIVESRAVHAAKLDAFREHRAKIHTLANRDDGAGLLSTLEQIDRDAKMDPAVRDHLLEAGLFEMSRMTPEPATRAAVNRFRDRPVNTFVRLQEERGQLIVPLYDLAATARLTKRVWDTADATDRVSNKLGASQWQPSDFLLPTPGMSLEAWQAGTRRAFETVEREFVAATKRALLQSQETSDKYDPLLLAAATRLDDFELFGAIISQGDASYARKAIGSVYRSLQSRDAATLLIGATARPELASAAILELGTRAAAEDEIRDWLLSRLGNPDDGASAALALARVADAGILMGIQAVILGDASALTKLRAALVLRLSESPAALTMRHELKTRTLSSEKLRQALL